MKYKIIYCLLCFAFLLTACSSSSETNTAGNADYITVGNSLKIKNTNTQLTLLDNKETLAADGLYYATWVMGNSEVYENSDGDSIDLYDAQLYLLLGESENSENAQRNIDSWLAAAKTNYEIINEEESTIRKQPYLLITYNSKNNNSPYSHGISAFGTFNNNAVCIELTCRENFTEDLKPILINFLNSCYYDAD